MKRRRIFLCLFLFHCVTLTYSQGWQHYIDSAKAFQDSDDLETAVEYYIKAKKSLPSDSAVSNFHIQLCKNIGDLYLKLTKYRNAEPFYLEGRDLFKQLNGTTEKPTYAAICDLLGQVYFRIDPSKAESFFIESKNIREKLYGDSSVEFASSCNNLGNLYNKIGKNDLAEIVYLQSIAIRAAKLGKQHADYAQSCNNLGNVYRDMGLYEKAEPLILEALRIREKMEPVKRHPRYAITLTNLANLYRDMGQYEKAEPNYLEAKKIRAKLEPALNNAEYAESCNILADLYYFMEKYEKAEPLYLEAKRIREKQNKDDDAYAQSCNNLANLYHDLGMYEKAMKLALEAMAIWDAQTGRNSSKATNYNTLGAISLALGNYKEAESYLLQAKVIWEKVLGKEHPYYIQNAYSLAKVFWNSGQMQQARELYSSIFYTQSNQISKFFKFTTEEEKTLYLRNINSSTDENLSFHYKTGDFERSGYSYDISLLNRNLIGVSEQQLRSVIYSVEDPGLNRLYEEWSKAKMQLARIYSRGADTTKQALLLERKADDFEKELSRNSSVFKSIQGNRIDWRDIQKKLKKDEAAIEFVRFQFYNGKEWTDSTYYIALLLRSDMKEPKLIPLFEEKKLNKIATGSTVSNINTVYRGGKLGNTPATQSSLQLYGLIWKPLNEYLRGISKIYFAPAGNLFKISFAAMPVDEKNTLSDFFQLVQLNSTASIVDLKNDYLENEQNIRLYGGIRYNASPAAIKKINSSLKTESNLSVKRTRAVSRNGAFAYLPGTRKEVIEITKLATMLNFSLAIDSGANATEESFKALTGKSSPAILHIATHGFFYPDPGKNRKSTSDRMQSFKQSTNPLLRSGLVFAGANTLGRQSSSIKLDDGIVTAYEVSNMYFPNTGLVVLSACETALGDIHGSEGVYGLQRSFKIAGVRHLLMSLWEVPDAETSEFMQEFYRCIFNKTDFRQAYYQTQNKLKEKYRKDPYKWAAWILIE